MASGLDKSVFMHSHTLLGWMQFAWFGRGKRNGLELEAVGFFTSWATDLDAITSTDKEQLSVAGSKFAFVNHGPALIRHQYRESRAGLTGIACVG